MADATIEQVEPPKTLNRLGNWMTGTVSQLPNPSLVGSSKEPNEPNGTDNVVDGTTPAGNTTDQPPASDPKTGTTQAKPETATGTADDLPEDKWPRSAQEWKKFKEAKTKVLTEREARIKSLESELTEVRSKITQPGVDPKEMESLKKERDQLSEQLKVADVVRHPRFKAYFDGKTTAQIELAKRIVGPDMANKVAEVLSLPDGTYRNNQIEEVMVGLGPIQQSRFGGILNALAELDNERQREIANAGASYDSLQQAQKAERETAQTNFQKAVTDTLQTVQDPPRAFPSGRGETVIPNGTTASRNG